jgi:hypothetical protein
VTGIFVTMPDRDNTAGIALASHIEGAGSPRVETSRKMRGVGERVATETAW